MINIEELRADIEANNSWTVRENAFRADVVNEGGITVAETWPREARRIARLPQLEREYLAMREALEGAEKALRYYMHKKEADAARKALGETQ